MKIPSPKPVTPTIRCAIYTRKSTEEGTGIIERASRLRELPDSCRTTNQNPAAHATGSRT